MSYLSHSTWLLANNAVHCCGYNEDGQMGLGTAGTGTDVYNFTKFTIPNETVATVAPGYMHTMVITASGKMFGFGNNEKGQLGTVRSGGTPVKENPNPTQVASNLLWANVSSGADHTLAISREGKVFAFGSNEYGQLGLGDNSSANMYSPVQIPYFTQTRAIKVLAGYNHSFVWTDDGVIHGFGRNDQSQLAMQSMVPQIKTPQKVNWGFPIAMLATGNTHSFAIDTKNQLWGVGYITKDFDYGQVPTLIHTFSESVVSLVSGVFHCLVLTASNKLYAMGQNGYKQVGLNVQGSVKNLAQITSLPLNGSRILSVAAGYHHSVVLTENNKLITWGAQSHGQLGLGTKSNFSLPTLVNSELHFSNLYLANFTTGSSSYSMLEPSEVIESVEVIALPKKTGGSNQDKDAIIRELTKKCEQQDCTIAMLQAEVDNLKIQISSQNNSRTLGDGHLNVTWVNK